MPTRRHYSGKEIQPFAEMNTIHIILCNNNTLYRLYQNDFLGSLFVANRRILGKRCRR